MQLDKNATTDDIVKTYISLVNSYIKGDESIQDAQYLFESAYEISKDAIEQLSLKISTLSHNRQFEVIELLEKITASTMLTGVAEVINKKQQHKDA